MAKAGLLNFLGKYDHHPFLFDLSHSKSESDHFLRTNLIYGRGKAYEYLNVISNGSFGIVYRARHKKIGEIIAMKPEFHGLSTSTLREIDILMSLFPHPAIVELKEIVVDDWDRVFVIMEHIERHLKRFMDIRRQPLHPNEVKCMMKQLLEGIKFLNENGVMHRDLKPSNILINKKGHLKICDYGPSRQFENEWGSYSPGVVILWYRAPVILDEAETYSTAIDMWSDSCIMAELLLKEVLFKGTSEVEQRAQIYMILGRGKPDDSRLIHRFLDAGVISGCPLLAEHYQKTVELGFDLLKKLLEYNPEKRITAEAAPNHGWFKELDPYFFSAPNHGWFKEFDPYFFWFSTTQQH
ncbi:Cyclin-dependent kinase G-1 [Sesamum alatum]|uniref:Cyclin-dependent kinase G-1 n=1 Tax=Sesamum alatum TaxID=300844 RepID=A0AAE1Y6T4_9LAMI|nr:Cyclin-dependent kinase G-1 [Sesamum alatum]